MASATSEDILNLAKAFEKIRQNRNLGGGYVLNAQYEDGILKAMKLATNRYIEELLGENDAKENSRGSSRTEKN